MRQLQISEGAWLAAALSTRACVHVAQGGLKQAADDAYEALALAARSNAQMAIPDILECFARAGTPCLQPSRSHSASRLRICDQATDRTRSV